MKIVYVIIILCLLLMAGAGFYRFLSGRRLIVDPIEAYRINRLSLDAADAIWQKKEKSAIVVSLTSIPSRIPHIENTLKTLLTQSLAPRRIELNIPEFSFREQRPYVIPDAIGRLEGVTVLPCKDFGPATKLIPALLRHGPDQAIVAVDDDYLYPKNMLKNFHEGMKRYPNVVLANSGWIVPPDCLDRPTTFWSDLWSIPPTPSLSTRLKTPKEVDIIQGYSGYLVCPGFFDKNAIQAHDTAPKALWFVDDVWISAHVNAPKYVLPAKRFCFSEIGKNAFYKGTSLANINRGDGSLESRNNTIGIRHFKEKWLFNGSHR
uniref:Glycosyl transferase family 2 n=1 Tax=Candidatus Kentrum sp. FW TaxID=2126338 RepID=A0A450T0K9_9GAMM|nr:MAG: hypothetical protein BECKFW1821A_GA0114235_109414 [Candidatus Kentron sp. FW]